jgi:hypothetical protein
VAPGIAGGRLVTINDSVRKINEIIQKERSPEEPAEIFFPEVEEDNLHPE